MGLNEKRMIKRLQEEVIPPREAELAEITGATLRYEIDWSRFLDSAGAINGLENWAFGVISDGFKRICRDDLGKQTVAERIKIIRITQWNSAWPTAVLGSDGILDMMWDWSGETQFTAEMFEDRVSEQL